MESSEPPPSRCVVPTSFCVLQVATWVLFPTFSAFYGAIFMPYFVQHLEALIPLVVVRVWRTGPRRCLPPHAACHCPLQTYGISMFVTGYNAWISTTVDPKDHGVHYDERAVQQVCLLVHCRERCCRATAPYDVPPLRLLCLTHLCVHCTSLWCGFRPQAGARDEGRRRVLLPLLDVRVRP